MEHPRLIQGGMGIGVSLWELARAVSITGQLGVVSGTGAEFVVARLLQLGDPGGDLRRALRHFPVPAIAEQILETYFVDGGIPENKPFKNPPFSTLVSDPTLIQLTVAANFCIVWLAKEDHGGVVGINYLEKLQRPHLPALYGALLAGVDYILMGAGIPIQIPRVLDQLTTHEPARYNVQVTGSTRDDDFYVSFDPRSIVSEPREPLKRPYFLPIISSTLLARLLMKAGHIDGFIIEGPTAGGHNAPPRGRMQLTPEGEPIYGPKDVVDLAVMRSLGLPFWLAGSYNTPDKMREALQNGAHGIQAGSIFALCDESRIVPALKSDMRRRGMQHDLRIVTDPNASPTGFPFKKAMLAGTLADPGVYRERRTMCDVGGLRELFIQNDGTVGYRCPAEPSERFCAKGGDPRDAEGRACLCNALLANVGLAQRRKDGVELPLVTLGDDHAFLTALLADGADHYTAEQAVNYLLQTA